MVFVNSYSRAKRKGRFRGENLSFKFAADRSNVATTARPQKEKLYEYTFVADLAPLTAFQRPCKASRFRFRNKTSPTPSRRTPEWRRRSRPSKCCLAIRQRISSRFPFPKQEWVSPHHSPCADPQKESIHQTQYKRVTLAKLIGMTSVPEKHYLLICYIRDI